MPHEDNNELMQLYGGFFYEFETVCSWIRHAILQLLYPKYGLKERNIVEVLMEGLTADPLRKKMLGLIKEYHDIESDIYVLANEIGKKFQKYIELRNSFAHGRAFVGQHDFIAETKEGAISLRHPKIKSKGLDLNFKTYEKMEMQHLVNDLKLFRNSIDNLIVLIAHSDNDIEFKSRFIKNIHKDLDALKFKFE